MQQCDWSNSLDQYSSQSKWETKAFSPCMYSRNLSCIEIVYYSTGLPKRSKKDFKNIHKIALKWNSCILASLIYTKPSITLITWSTSYTVHASIAWHHCVFSRTGPERSQKRSNLTLHTRTNPQKLIHKHRNSLKLWSDIKTSDFFTRPVRPVLINFRQDFNQPIREL
jgi:hypothetical protein